MDIYGQLSPQLILFLLLYGGVTVTGFILCFYLLLRKGNAIVADITPPMRLRRWTAAFFAVTALGHIWWLLFYFLSRDMHSASYVLVVMLDCVTLPTTIAGMLLSMLQDRQRPLWPIVIAMIPAVILGGLQMVWPDIDFLNLCFVYVLALYVFFTIYMVIAVRKYGRWLRDNYADLEHKEVWQSHTLLIVLLLFILVYGFTDDSIIIFYLIQIANFVLFGFLLWRVETLPQLEVVSRHQVDSLPARESSAIAEMVSQETDLLTQKAQVIPSNIGELLAEHCVDTQLYLQHDLTLAQLSSAVGINRTYLSHYFSSQDMNYNTYINGLRINYFVSRYHEIVAKQQSFTAQQLAQESGYRSYSTFSSAFKQRMGQSVTAWIRDQETSQ